MTRGTDRLAKDYGLLTPEERFRLISSASGRGDEAERDRLARAGQKIHLTFRDHWPFGQAASEMSHLTYIELVEDAAFYRDALDRAGDALVGRGGGASRRLSEHRREADVALAAGYVLKAKSDGWGLFCSRLGLPPFLLWEGYPGLRRLRRALDRASVTSFSAEGMLAWLNRARPKGEPEVPRVALTPQAVADATEGWFRQRAEWWGG